MPPSIIFWVIHNESEGDYLWLVHRVADLFGKENVSANGGHLTRPVRVMTSACFETCKHRLDGVYGQRVPPSTLATNLKVVFVSNCVGSYEGELSPPRGFQIPIVTLRLTKDRDLRACLNEHPAREVLVGLGVKMVV